MYVLIKNDPRDMAATSWYVTRGMTFGDSDMTKYLSSTRVVVPWEHGDGIHQYNRKFARGNGNMHE